MEQNPKHDCPQCAARAKDEVEKEEFNLAVLLALMPLVVMTFFTQLGLL